MSIIINPFVRYIAKTTYYMNMLVTARDCRLLYLLEGRGTFECEGRIYPLIPHTLLYYPYGIPYRISAEPDEKSMLFYTVNFDFTQDFAHITGPLSPCPLSAGQISPELQIPQHAEPICRESQTQQFAGPIRGNTKEYDHQAILCSISGNLSPQGKAIFSKICYLPNALWAENCLQQIYSEEVRQNLCSHQLQSAYMSIILLELYRRVSTPALENPLCIRAKELIAQNLHYTNNTLAAFLNYHPYYLNDLFKKNTGITLHQYILRQRLARAYELIATTQMSIEEIALQCGFCSQSHLSHLFKDTYHITPARLRRSV
ncbi:MAG: helix-turn-helix transcriptional regulator [Lachnospiraceae bacterium]|nr:helix-turn-helix transcriptional regulator [Lachnospiraceae bacterium]